MGKPFGRPSQGKSAGGVENGVGYGWELRRQRWVNFGQHRWVNSC